MSEITNLAKLREPFPAHHISKLPKPTAAQTDEVKANYRKGIRCQVCGGWHHPDVVHLDYVGHAALTDRLLDTDPAWTWEPLALGPDGTPVVDNDGGMWIKLTVCGITRLGYGDAQGKKGGNAVKERIGDALRNAAMRFGAALDLWHKGELHVEAEPEAVPPKGPPKLQVPPCETKDYILTAERAEELYDAAAVCIDKFRQNDKDGAYDEISGITSNGEKLFLWAVLKEFSAVRSYIKSRWQNGQTQPAEA